MKIEFRIPLKSELAWHLFQEAIHRYAFKNPHPIGYPVAYDRAIRHYKPVGQAFSRNGQKGYITPRFKDKIVCFPFVHSMVHSVPYSNVALQACENGKRFKVLLG